MVTQPYNVIGYRLEGVVSGKKRVKQSSEQNLAVTCIGGENACVVKTLMEAVEEM